MTIGRVCPQCHYQRKPVDNDYTPAYECPQCGIIYDKFIPPEVNAATDDNEADNAPSATITSEANSNNTISSGRPKLIYAALLLIAVFALYYFFVKASGPFNSSHNSLSGTYAGELSTTDDEKVSIEFDIDEKRRITRIFKTRNYIYNVYKAQETIVWKYPDTVEITFTQTAVNDPKNYKTYSLKRSVKKHTVQMSDHKAGFFVDSTFDAQDPENSLPDVEIKNLSKNKNVYYVELNHTFFKSSNIQINPDGIQIPKQLNFENISLYCATARNDIRKIIGEAELLMSNSLLPLYTYQLSPGFGVCSFALENYGFRPQLKFMILADNIHSHLQSIYDREMKLSDLSFEIADLPYRLEIPEYRMCARISININGYGQAGYPGPSNNIPVCKIGRNLPDEALHGSTEEWKTAFIKSHRNETFKASQERKIETAKESMKKMFIGPKQDDTK